MTSGTELRMLWEAVDPTTALTKRFGFTDVDHAVSWLEGTLREVWASRMDRCDRLVMSASNLLAWLTVDGKHVIAKCCVDPARFARLAEVDALVSWLHAEGVPVAAAITAGGDRLRVERGRFSIGLYPFIEGDLLDVVDVGQVEAAGRTLAMLHQALAVYPRPFGSGLALPNQQLVHGDFRSANILYNGARITAVLDFDEVANRSRVADLAQAAVLLATRYHHWEPTSSGTRATFVAAYSDLAPLTSTERDELQRRVTALLNHFGWT